jgi:uncharacterized membrane protein YbhN (UPF0104 family)
MGLETVKLLDYLLIRTPAARMSEAVGGAEPSKVPTSRIVISLFGLILGVAASFFFTGLGARTDIQKGAAKNPPAVSQVGQASQPAGSASRAPDPDPQIKPFTWQRFGTVCLISLVICGISYQGLYFALRLYQGEHAVLIFFVAFQYGYFWQSVVKGATGALM